MNIKDNMKTFINQKNDDNNNNNNNNNNNKLYQFMIASLIGTSSATLLLNPVVVIKVILQGSTNITKKETPLSVIKSIYKTNGIKGFWVGSKVGLLQAVPSNMIYMTIYERLKILVKDVDKNNENLVKASAGIAGGLSRLVSVSVIAPVELIRTQQMGAQRIVGNPGLSGFQLAKNIYKESGINGFYRGWTNNILRDVPFSALYWNGFEYFKSKYTDIFNYNYSSKDNNSKFKSFTLNSNFINFLSGVTAGLIATICSHPFDVLKTQRQLEINKKNNRNKQYKNFDLLKELFRKGDTFRGLSMRLATVLPSSAIMVTIYEAVKNIDI
jgi:solute carrier family 25 protein 39/40